MVLLLFLYFIKQTMLFVYHCTIGLMCACMHLFLEIRRCGLAGRSERMEVVLHATRRSTLKSSSFFSHLLSPCRTARYGFASFNRSRVSVACRGFWTLGSGTSVPSNSRSFLTSPLSRPRSIALLSSAFRGERHYAVAPLKSRETKQQQQQQQQPAPKRIAENIYQVTEKDWKAKVIDASHTAPVILDCYAE